MMTIKIPDGLSEGEQLAWLRSTFEKVAEKCKLKKKKEFEFGVNYGRRGDSTDGEKVPCVKTWTLKEIKKWLKGDNHEKQKKK